MLKEYVSKHSEYKGEAIDCDALILKAKEDLSYGRFDQSEREFPLNVFQGKEDFEEGVEYHFNASVRQFVAAKMVYENDMKYVVKEFSDYEQEELIYKLGKDMIAKYSCAIQHTAACDVLKYLKSNLPKILSKNMRKANEDKKYAERVLLTAIVKEIIKGHRPKDGWSGAVVASQDITKKIIALNEICPLPIEHDENKLFDKVSKLIELEPSVIKVYKEAAKNSREDPAALRRVKFGKW